MISSSSQVSSIRSHQYHRPQRKTPSVSFASSSHHHHHHNLHQQQNQRAYSKRSHSESHATVFGVGGEATPGGGLGDTSASSVGEGNQSDGEAKDESFFNFLRPRNLRKSISKAVRNLKSDQG